MFEIVEVRGRGHACVIAVRETLDEAIDHRALLVDDYDDERRFFVRAPRDESMPPEYFAAD